MAEITKIQVNDAQYDIKDVNTPHKFKSTEAIAVVVSSDELQVTHSDNAGYKHIPIGGGSEDQMLVGVQGSSGTAKWTPKGYKCNDSRKDFTTNLGTSKSSYSTAFNSSTVLSSYSTATGYGTIVAGEGGMIGGKYGISLGKYSLFLGTGYKENLGMYRCAKGTGNKLIFDENIFYYQVNVGDVLIIQNSLDILGAIQVNAKDLDSKELSYNKGRVDLDTTSYSYSFTKVTGGIAIGDNSVAFGNSTVANKDNQLVCGIYNDFNVVGDILFVVGNGNPSKRSNALTVNSTGNVIAAGDVKSNNGANSLNTLATKVAALEANPKSISFIKPSEYSGEGVNEYPLLPSCIGNPSYFGLHMNVGTIEDDMLHSDGYRFNNMEENPIYLRFMGMTTADGDINTKTFSLMDGEGNIYLLKASSDTIISFEKKA